MTYKSGVASKIDIRGAESIENREPLSGGIPACI